MYVPTWNIGILGKLPDRIPSLGRGRIVTDNQFDWTIRLRDARLHGRDNLIGSLIGWNAD
jgi:hypothetical protein